ncbi:MAG TPA: hypothetical protein VKT49_12695 [Bryobacteraceae bacterium]|nr:hypothetical protein [Bryobacteraceae bacterium]
MYYRSASILGLIVVFAGIAFAQQTAPVPIYSQTQSTGTVGILATQVAHLNVVNLSSATVAGSAATCAAHIEFLNEQGGVLKPFDITVDPGKSVSVEYTSPSAAGRQQFRVTIAIPRPAMMTPAPGSTILMPIFYCSLVPTLEILDGPGGKTDFLVTDFHYVASPIPILSGLPIGTSPMR